MVHDATTASEPSEAVLTELPSRALKFLSYITRNPAVYTTLAQSGLDHPEV